MQPDGGSVDGAPTELAALEAARSEKRELLDHAASVVVAGLGPKGKLPGGCPPDHVPALLQRYYWSEPAAEVLGHDPAELAGLALGHLKLAEVRLPGLGHRRRAPPPRRPRGRPAGHRRHALPRRLGHRRGGAPGRGPGAHRAPGGRRPARRHRPDQGVLRQLRRRLLRPGRARPSPGWPSSSTGRWTTRRPPTSSPGLRTVLDDVRAVDEDADRMRARILEIAERLDKLAAEQEPVTGSDPADDPAEAAALLRWLVDGNFVFLGARDVDLVQRSGKPSSRAVPGTGLGVLRSDTDMSESVTRLPEASRTPRQHLLTVTKADARSPVHRPAVAGPRGGQPPARQRRAAVPLRRAVPLHRLHQQRARHAARAAPGRGGHQPLRRAGRQPHRQGAAGGPRDLSPRRAAAGRRRRAAAGRARRPAPAGTQADPAVPPP